jgi:DNA-binding transcriptional ArsR family regulator
VEPGVLRGLNNRIRQQIINFIHKEGRVNVSTIYKKLHIEQSIVSQHLCILREARFVNTEKAGKEIYYSINYERFAEVDRLRKKILK